MKTVEIRIPFEELKAQLRRDIAREVVFTNATVDRYNEEVVVEGTLPDEDHYVIQNFMLRG